LAAGVQDKDATADAVLGNVKAMDYAVQSVAVVERVEVQDFLDIHRALMEHSDQPEIAGLIRAKQNWIGGNNFNPCQAAFVPPPPEYVEALMEDLCAFVNRDDLPGTVQAGLAHAQFETIHPFADGNGRTGRALIHVILKRRGLASTFIPPISLALATRASAYVGGLSSFRYTGPPDGQAALDGIRDWLDLFLTATRRATEDAAALQRSLVQLELEWRGPTQTTQRQRGRTPTSGVDRASSGHRGRRHAIDRGQQICRVRSYGKLRRRRNPPAHW
jgi:Fic family protein